MNEQAQKAAHGIGLWQLFGFGMVSLLGTLLHFLYDLSGTRLAALLSAVNESTWEHMKLLFFPLPFFALAERYFVGQYFAHFWCIKLKGTLLGLLLIPVLFYTLNGAFGKTPDFVNIAIFFVAAAAVFLYETKLFKADDTPCPGSKWAIFGFLVLAAAFVIFTFWPLPFPLFQDPIDGSFGLQK